MKILESAHSEIRSNTAKNVPESIYDRRLPIGIHKLDARNPVDNELLHTAEVVINSDLEKHLRPNQLWLLDPQYLLSLACFSVPIEVSQIKRSQLAESGRDADILHGWIQIGPFLFEGVNQKGGFISGVPYHGSKDELIEQSARKPVGFIDPNHAMTHLTTSNILLQRNIRVAVSPGYVVFPKEAVGKWLLQKWNDAEMQHVISNALAKVSGKEIALLFRCRMIGERPNTLIHTEMGGLSSQEKFNPIDPYSVVRMASYFLRETQIPHTLIGEYLRQSELTIGELTQALKQTVSSKGHPTSEATSMIGKLLDAICKYQASPERWKLNDTLGHQLISPQRLLMPTDYDLVMCVYDLERLTPLDEAVSRSALAVYLHCIKNMVYTIKIGLQHLEISETS